TTRAGMLTAPLRDRFGLYYHLDFYPSDELKQIVLRSARLLETKVDNKSAEDIAGRSRGTPRVANRLLRRVRDYASVKGNGIVESAIACAALEAEGIDAVGLDPLDRKLLKVVINYYKGGPVGIEALGATLNEEVDTLVDMVEPFLLKIGYIQRTSRGRMASIAAAQHLGLRLPGSASQETLF
ncbi:MAG: Holliday junction DNA helicase RuvB C-terminal domain-containing protein, partial [Candidatus Zixiibacteriota bacterium]